MCCLHQAMAHFELGYVSKSLVHDLKPEPKLTLFAARHHICCCQIFSYYTYIGTMIGVMCDEVPRDVDGPSVPIARSHFELGRAIKLGSLPHCLQPWHHIYCCKTVSYWLRVIHFLYT
jgi:hypothetical protein